jgi:hypothetical protein
VEKQGPVWYILQLPIVICDDVFLKLLSYLKHGKCMEWTLSIVEKTASKWWVQIRETACIIHWLCMWSFYYVHR